MFPTEGMSIADFRRHPVYQLIYHASYAGSKGLPTRAELDRLALPEDVRSRVMASCREVAKIHDTGDHQTAWSKAETAAEVILRDLPEEQRNPHYFDPDESGELSALSPAELAARVPRRS